MNKQLEELLDKCCVCGKPYGLVWNHPGFLDRWVHFACTEKGGKES